MARRVAPLAFIPSPPSFGAFVVFLIFCIKVSLASVVFAFALSHNTHDIHTPPSLSLFLSLRVSSAYSLSPAPLAPRITDIKGG